MTGVHGWPLRRRLYVSSVMVVPSGARDVPILNPSLLSAAGATSLTVNGSAACRLAIRSKGGTRLEIRLMARGRILSRGELCLVLKCRKTKIDLAIREGSGAV